MRRPILAALAAAALTLGAASPALAGHGGGGQYGGVRCGDVISGTVTLTRDLRCDDVGLVLEPGATLDLGGHRLIGPGTGSGVALRVDPEAWETPVAVRNGTVRDWQYAFGAETGNLAASLADLRIRDVAWVFPESYLSVTIDRTTFDHAEPGFFWGGEFVLRDSRLRDSGVINGGPFGPGIVVERSTFVNSGIVGSCTDGGMISVSDSTFRDGTSALDSGWCGLELHRSTFRGFERALSTSMDTALGSPGTHQVVGNTFARNDVAYELAARAVVQGNTFTRNGIGIHSETQEWGNGGVEDVVLDANTFTRNGDGVVITTLVHASGNTAVRNTGYGLYLPAAVDLGGNVARRNGVDCVGVVCAAH